MKKRKSKKVMVFGVFDLFHPGHKFFLKEASQRGDFLVVVVARDENVKNRKGSLPVDKEDLRREKVERWLKKTAISGKVILGKNDFSQRHLLLKEEKPDIICLGYDQEIDQKDLLFWDSCDILKNPVVERIKPYKPEIYKSSKVKKR